LAGITLAQAQTQLDAYLAASIACSNNQEYRIAGRVYRRAQLDFILKMVDYWDAKVQSLSRGGVRVVGVSPLD